MEGHGDTKRKDRPEKHEPEAEAKAGSTQRTAASKGGSPEKPGGMASAVKCK